MLDTEIREMQRRIRAGDTTLIPQYIAATQRAGLKLKLKSFHPRDFNIYIKMGFDSEPLSAPMGTFYYVAQYKEAANHAWDQSRNEVWHCEHKHAEPDDAAKCAKRRTYCVITNNQELLSKYVKIGEG